MRKSPTLPNIKEKNPDQISGIKSKQTFRRLEDKVNSQNEEIVTNEKMISSLAHQFKLLKEQLQFQQEYSQNYKSTVGKYQEESNKYMRTIKDQKVVLFKLQKNLSDKSKLLEAANHEIKQIKSMNYQEEIDQLQKNIKKLQISLKTEESEREKLQKELKQKIRILREKQNSGQQAQQIGAKLRQKQAQVAQLEKDIAFCMTCLNSCKEEGERKDNENKQLKTKIFVLEEKISSFANSGVKQQTTLEENKLLNHTIQQLTSKISQLQNLTKPYEQNLRRLDQKNHELGGRLSQEKRQNKEKMQVITKQLAYSRKKLEDQFNNKAEQFEKKAVIQKKMQKLEEFQSKMLKLKEHISQQLIRIKESIVCDYCKKGLKEPVTSIPCGHSFCLTCKKGYQKECSKCPGLKREAVYRNQLLDQIINTSTLVESILNHIQFQGSTKRVSQ